MRALSLLLTLCLASPVFAAETFALIVTNNQSPGRAELRYADDDGAKYYELFAMLGSPAHVRLLTQLDRDTTKLFPAVAPIAIAPTMANVTASFAAMRRDLADHPNADFYFVFAGHGDVDRGQGYLELADGRLGPDELTQLLATLPSTVRRHVILDSCNSYFVLNPRKPGGRRFFAHDDAARLLGERMPNVGVFLSTSAEAEVFEWSELQSGIFSHAVRSGLMGAADANGDGRVTYEELEAFVTIAARSVKNPLFRPHVFSRGPRGQAQAAIVDLRASQAATLILDDKTPRRLTIRDRDELPWIDLHRESGTSVLLYLPSRIADRIVVEAPEGDRVAHRWEHTAAALAPTQSIALAGFAATPVATSARGIGDLFRALFADPFGPDAMRAFANQPPQPPPIGASSEDLARMELLLEQTAGIAHASRMNSMILGYSLSAMCLVGGGVLLRHGWDHGSFEAIAGVSLASTAAITSGIWPLMYGRKTDGEKAFLSWRSGLASGRPLPEILAKTETQLFRYADRAHRERRNGQWMGWVIGGLGSLALLGGGLRYGLGHSSDRNARIEGLVAIGLGGLFVPLGVAAAVSSSFESTQERMVRLWTAESGAKKIPRVSITPLPSGGAMSLAGSF